jgi:hypothetical protein
LLSVVLGVAQIAPLPLADTIRPVLFRRAIDGAL